LRERTNPGEFLSRSLGEFLGEFGSITDADIQTVAELQC
jgi:hypothetical protein